MSRYIMGNRSTERYITVIEPESIRPQRRGKKSTQPSTKPAVAQRTEQHRSTSQSSTIRLRGNEGSSSAGTSRELNASAVNGNPSAVPNQPKTKVSDVKLRERLIHLLVLRPHEKSELYDRIYEEGLKECERKVFTTILSQVAFFKGGAYHLKENLKNCNVQEEWPFYTEEDRAILQARKVQNLTSPGSSDGSSGNEQSPNSTHPGSPPLTTAPCASLQSYKRPADHEGNDDLSTKRRRYEEDKTDSTDNSITISFGDNRRVADNGNVDDGVNTVSYSIDSIIDIIDDVDTEQALVSLASAADYGVCERNASGTENGGNVSDVMSETDVHVNSLRASDVCSNGNTSTASLPCISNSTESPKRMEYIDFFTYYTTITSVEQKLRYKANFNADYDEYCKLHAELMKAWQRIADIEDRLNHLRKSGNQKEFEEMKQYFILEHSKSKYDPERLQKERRFYYLHNKLAHIRRLVDEYNMLDAIINMQPEECYGNSNCDIGTNVASQPDSL